MPSILRAPLTVAVFGVWLSACTTNHITRDLCPDDPSKESAGACGCGMSDADVNGNGVPDCLDAGIDLCPSDPAKTQAGTCGCGLSDADGNQNGVPDCLDDGIDLCPADAAKTLPGLCGCGSSDADANGNGVPDCLDAGVDLCPSDPAKTQAGACGCGVSDVDGNGNGVPDCFDTNSMPDAGGSMPDAGGSTPDAGAPPPCILDVTGSPSTTMRLTHLGLPSLSGFNLDGINNSSATGGATVAGCGRSDATGGVDNALGSIATTLAGLVDMNTLLQDSLVHSVADGGTEGAMTVDVELFGLDPSANDSCVSMRLTIQSVGKPDVVVTGVGSNVNNVLDVALSGAVRVDLAFPLPQEACNNQMCTGADTLPMNLLGAVARLNLNAGHVTLNAGSMLGGFLFFEDCTGGTIDFDGVCQGGTYAAENPTGFKQSIRTFADTVNLDDTFQTMLSEAFRGGRDLHMEPDQALSPCTGANNTSTNKNSVSIALSIDSL